MSPESIFDFFKSRPVKHPDFNRHAKEILQFLQLPSERFDLYPIYVSSGALYLNTVFIPRNEFQARIAEENVLTEWSHSIRERCLVFDLISTSEKEWLEVHGPFGDDPRDFYKNGEASVYFRPTLRGESERKNKIEFSQRLIHASEVSWVEKREAFCSLDSEGNYLDEFFVKNEGRLTIAYANLDKLKLFAHCTKQVMVSVFLIHTTQSDYGCEDSRSEETVEGERHKYCELSIFNKKQELITTHIRGSNWDYGYDSEEQALITLNKMYSCSDEESKKYESFIADDWKNGEVKEISCAPGSLASYFEKSDKPFETTPAFFSPDVLLSR